MLQRVISVAALMLLAISSASAEEPGPRLAERGKLIVADDFNRAEAGDAWRLSRGSKLVDGVLTCEQMNPTHGTVARRKIEFRDAVIRLRFRLNEAKYIAFVSDDKLTAPTTHSGHLCRVYVTPTSLRLGDDKEGAMRLDILALRTSDDPQKKAEGEKLVEGRSATVPIELKTDAWHTLEVELVGDVMRASIDEKPLVRLKSPGIAHPTKREFGPTVGGRTAQIDDLEVYEATPIAASKSE